MGRKPTRKLKYYQTICWMRLIKQVSGKTAYWLEYELFPELQGKKFWYYDRPRILDKYQIGRSVPRHGLGEISKVDKLEDLYSGTRWLFEHPIWSVIEPSTTFLQDADQLLHRLNKGIKTELFEGSNGVLLQRAGLNKDDYNKIFKDGTLDNFAVFFILLNEAKLKGLNFRYSQLLSVLDRNYQIFNDVHYFFGLGEKILAYVDSLHPDRYLSQTDKVISIAMARGLEPVKIMKPIIRSVKHIHIAESLDLDTESSQQCLHCGGYGPWSAGRCMVCGRMSDLSE